MSSKHHKIDAFLIAIQLVWLKKWLTTSSWMAIKKASLFDACCSWASSIDELFLERNASATICSWAVRHVTALIVFHYFTSVFITMCKQQRCWKLKAFNVIFQHLDVLHTLLVFLILNISIKLWKKQYFINYSLFF